MRVLGLPASVSPDARLVRRLHELTSMIHAGPYRAWRGVASRWWAWFSGSGHGNGPAGGLDSRGFQAEGPPPLVILAEGGERLVHAGQVGGPAVPVGRQPGSHPWHTLVEFAGVIVVTVALASARFKRAVRR